MYVKHNNIIIAEKMEEIPSSELTPGTQIMFIKPHYNKYLDKNFNKTIQMITNNIVHNHLFLFECVTTYPDIGHKEVQTKFKDEHNEEYTEYEYKYDESYYDSFHHEQAYIITDEFVYPIIENPEKNDRISMATYTINSEANPHVNSFYNDIFVKYNNINVNKGIYGDKDKFNWFLSIALDDDSCIVFVLDNEITVNTYRWNLSKKVIIMHRDRTYTYIECDFDELFDICRKSRKANSYQVDDFIDLLNIFKYDIRNYLHDSEEDRNKMLNKISMAFLYFDNIGYGEILKFYKPIYEDVNLKFKAYISGIREYNRSLIYEVDGKVLTHTDRTNINYDNPIYNAIRIAKQMYMFICQNNTGIHYLTGDLYRNGEQIHEYGYIRIIYKTFDCVWTRYDNRDDVYYIRVNSHFVLSDKNNPNDILIINEMKENKRLAETLAERSL